MNILLLSQVPSIFYKDTGPNQPFPPYQAQTFWLRALKSLGHEVTTFRYSDSHFLPNQLSQQIDLAIYQSNRSLYGHYRQWENKNYDWLPETWQRSRKLIQLIAKTQPEVILISGGIAHISRKSLVFAKSQFFSNIYLLNGENPNNSVTRFERNNLDLFDVIVCNDPIHAQNWQKIGAKKATCLPYSAIDPTVHRRLELTKSEQKKYGCDVVFVGTLTKDRQEILLLLAKQDFRLKIFGFLPEKHLLSGLRASYGGEAFGEESVKIYNASKIAINFVPEHMPIGGNMRTFEIPGAGALEFVSRIDPSWYQDDQEVVVFDNSNLLTKLQYYLNHPKELQTIAQNGYERTHADHTYQQRFKKLLGNL